MNGRKFTCCKCRRQFDGYAWQTEGQCWVTPGVYPTLEFCSKECARDYSAQMAASTTIKPLTRK